ncbi:MAG: hypothetical protein R2941_06380 [Desulfobacterales bacterium]
MKEIFPLSHAENTESLSPEYSSVSQIAFTISLDSSREHLHKRGNPETGRRCSDPGNHGICCTAACRI